MPNLSSTIGSRALSFMSIKKQMVNQLGFGTKKRSARQREVSQRIGRSNALQSTDKENIPPIKKQNRSQRSPKEIRLPTPPPPPPPPIASQKRKHSEIENELTKTRQQLAKTTQQLNGLRTTHQNALKDFDVTLQNSQHQKNRLKSDVYNLKRQLGRAKKSRKIATSSLTAAQKELAREQKKASKELSRRVSRLKNAHELETMYLRNTLKRTKEVLVELRESNRELKYNVSRLSRNLANSAAAGAKEARDIRTREGGVYTYETRTLLAMLRAYGLPSKLVPLVVKAFADAWNLNLNAVPSSQTGERAVVEVGVAGEAQIVDEAVKAGSYVFSGDGTTHYGVQLESREMTVYAPDYANPDLPNKPVDRFLQVKTVASHTAEGQAQNFCKMARQFIDTYNQFAIRSGRAPVDAGILLRLLVAIHSDHASDQKLFASIMEKLREDEWMAHLGKLALDAKSEAELEDIAIREFAQAVMEAGGWHAWDLLSEDEKEERSQAAHQATIASFGEEAYLQFPPEKQRSISRIVWAGCAMHKELNCFKAAAKGVSEYWIVAGEPGPVLLMNKDNDAAATVSDASKQRAEEVSTGGAIKTASIAGAVLNHRDAKKGEGDQVSVWFEEFVGVLLQFPDVSNTRFGSNGEAALILLLYLVEFREYLENMCYRKGTPGLNHMQANLKKALNDIPTLTELAALALYTLCISRPYMKLLRNPTKNMLDQAALHTELKVHLDMLLNHANHVLDPSTPPEDICF